MVIQSGSGNCSLRIPTTIVKCRLVKETRMCPIRSHEDLFLFPLGAINVLLLLWSYLQNYPQSILLVACGMLFCRRTADVIADGRLWRPPAMILLVAKRELQCFKLKADVHWHHPHDYCLTLSWTESWSLYSQLLREGPLRDMLRCRCYRRLPVVACWFLSRFWQAFGQLSRNNFVFLTRPLLVRTRDSD